MHGFKYIYTVEIGYNEFQGPVSYSCHNQLLVIVISTIYIYIFNINISLM